MQRPPGHDRLVLAPSDITAFLACGRLTQESLRAALGLRGRLPRDESPHAKLLEEHGNVHEARQLERLSTLAGGHEKVEVPRGGSAADLRDAAAHTADLMRAGAPLIAQGVVFDGRWQGKIDVLRRIERASKLGGHAYEVVDVKLARSVKPYVVHQLSVYARLVARLQGDVVQHAVALLGDETEERIDLRRFAALHRHVVARLEALVAAPPHDVYPEPVAHCELCRIQRECHRRRRADDHLSFVAGVRRDHRDALVAADVPTLAALAALDPAAAVPDLAPERLHVLRSQAALQRDSRRQGRPLHDDLPAERERGLARLPEPSTGDVFFDFEGDPYVGPRGIEYLWGWSTVDGEYHHLWAHDEAGEARALRRFVDWVDERRRRFPGLHVFHYGAHEASKLKSLAQQHGTREDEIDRWLRGRLLVDLYAVVRQGLQVGEESYSLKRLERHYGFVRQEHTVRDGGGSIVAYEAWLAGRDPEVLEAIRRYNAEDCASTAALARWLRDVVRPAVAAGQGVDFAELAKPGSDGEPHEPRWAAEVAPVRERLLAGLPEDQDAVLDADQAERRLLAGLLLYHGREAKPQYWNRFALKDLTPDVLVDERDALGMIALDKGVPPVLEKSSYRWTYRFPVQETSLEAGSTGVDPVTDREFTIVELGEEHLVLKRGKDEPAPDVRALIAAGPPNTDALRRAAITVADAVLDEPHRFPAVRALLRREPPTVDLASCGPSVEQLVAATLALGDSYLPVQGPPGTGKTFRAAHMVVAALRAGRRVALTAPSHAAIHNLLRAVEDRAAKEGVRGWRGVYKGDGYASPHGLVCTVATNKRAVDAEDPFDLVAGTAWLLARPEHRAEFDLLFVDEAGQFGLANAVAAGPAARGIVLLGDPQQLPQVNQAAHPFGAGASVLAHVLGGADVVPPDRGVFLDTSWRMHPAVGDFVSERSYEGRLRSTEGCARRRVDAPGRLSGAGLRAVAVEHEGRSQESPEEAAAVASLCRELLAGGATVTDDAGRVRPLTASDVLVVAPYNLARRAIAAQVPAGVRVGTVDKFQGQEAPVVFFAMTCSSGEDVPRGLGFLFNRNRLNVAVSRAQCLAVLVHAPRLLDADCRTLEQMELLEGVCAFVEAAERVSAEPDALPRAA